jgi:hypothetical protein
MYLKLLNMEPLQEITATCFDNKWWSDFLAVTSNLSKTAVFNDCMDSTETHLLRQYVLQIIRELARLRTARYGYRVYIDGKLLDHNEMELMYNNPPSENEELEEWSTRVFGNSKFGMILNLGEKFNLQLSKNIALKTKPLLEKVGFPREGINFSIFIGNYDKTPLGIHKDPPGQDVIHFHLGPCDKTMYTWERKEYEYLTKEKKIHKQDIESLLPYAKIFTFSEGDIYFMPEGEYHIGKQDGLSMAITFWRYNHTKDKLAKKLQEVLFAQFLQKNEDLLISDTNSLDDVSGLDETLSIVKIPDELENLNYKDLMREAYKDLRYSIHSNAGYRTTPLPQSQDIKFDLDDIIVIEEPFRILYKESLNKKSLHVFIRGTKVELNNFQCIKTLIDELNKGKKNKVSDLLAILDESWDKEIGIYLLDTFYKNNGIRKVATANTYNH